jgi:hypothetical protein
MPEVHLLIGVEVRQTGIACGSLSASSASWDTHVVTCPQCRDTLRRRTTPGGMSEKQVQELVRRAAGLGGWLYFHTWNARHSPAGYPDVTAIRHERLVVAELKRQGQTPTREQAQWLEAFQGVRTVEAYVWTPADVETLLEVLR